MERNSTGGHGEFDAFFYIALDPLCITDTHGMFRRVNPAWEGVLGRPIEELEGRSYTELVHPDDVASTQDVLTRMANRGSVVGFVNRLRNTDGSYRWIEWQATSPDGETVYAAARDITESREAEEALRLSEEKFSTAFRTSPDSVNINRIADGLYIEVNEGFTNLTGYTAAEVAGRTSLELDIWADPSDRDRLLAGLRESGRVDNLEAGFRFKDGSVRTGLMSARIIQVQGEPCILSVTRDISERKAAQDRIVALNAELEERVQERTEQLASMNEELTALNEEQTALIEELERANRHLDEATRAKSEFLAGMSHELRTPLNSILGFSGTLYGGLAGPLTDEQRKQIGMINSAGRHLLHLINGVLDLAKIESGHTVLSIEDASVAAVVGLAVDTVRPLAAEKGLELVTIGLEEAGTVRTDPMRVGQVLLNLLGNAVKFTDTGSVTVEVTRDDREVRIAVRDTGRGISEAELSHIFEEFFQVPLPEGGKTQGTGLGLSVSNHLAGMLGGYIEAASELGSGSEFTLHLPVEGRLPEGDAPGLER